MALVEAIENVLRKKDLSESELINVITKWKDDEIAQKENEKYNTFYIAASFGYISAIKFLLKFNVNPNIRHPFNRNYAIHQAVKKPEVFRYLLNCKNVDFSLLNDFKQTVLHQIILDKNISRSTKADQVLDLLIFRTDIPIDALDLYNNTALYYAAENEDLVLVLILSSIGKAKMNIKCGDENIPLMKIFTLPTWTKVKKMLLKAKITG